VNKSNLLLVVAILNLHSLTVCAADDTQRIRQLKPVTQGTGTLHLSLVGYLDSSLSPAAESFESGDVRGTLSWLAKAKPKYPTVVAQSRYLKAMCLQSLHQFAPSILEYRWVERHSPDSVLSTKAAIGRKLAEQRSSNINSEQMLFPGGPALPSPFE
jgi:hypothetical protein